MSFVQPTAKKMADGSVKEATKVKPVFIPFMDGADFSSDESRPDCISVKYKNEGFSLQLKNESSAKTWLATMVEMNSVMKK